MAFSKIILNGVTQIDLTQDTTQADKTIQGYTGHQNDGTGFTGSYVPPTDFLVTLSLDTNTVQWVADKTYAQIKAAYDSGQTIKVEAIRDGDPELADGRYYDGEGLWYRVSWYDYSGLIDDDDYFYYFDDYFLDENGLSIYREGYRNAPPKFTITYSGDQIISSTCSMGYNEVIHYNTGGPPWDIALVSMGQQGDSPIVLPAVLIGTTSGGVKYTSVSGLNPDSDITFYSNGNITVTKPSIYNQTLNITSNGTYLPTNMGVFTRVDVAVPASTPTLQSKTITPTKSTQTVQADSGYDGLDTVTVNPYVASLQSKTATPTTSQQTITADSSYDGLSQVTVNPIPSEYIIPTGTKSITANGTGIDVAAYATVDVNVPSSGGGMVIQDVVDTDGGTIRTITGVEISGTKTITENGTYDVSQYASADVSVSGAEFVRTATITYVNQHDIPTIILHTVGIYNGEVTGIDYYVGNNETITIPVPDSNEVLIQVKRDVVGTECDWEVTYADGYETLIYDTTSIWATLKFSASANRSFTIISKEKTETLFKKLVFTNSRTSGTATNNRIFIPSFTVDATTGLIKYGLSTVASNGSVTVDFPYAGSSNIGVFAVRTSSASLEPTITSNYVTAIGHNISGNYRFTTCLFTTYGDSLPDTIPITVGEVTT